MKSILSIRVFRFAGFIFSLLSVVATVASGQSRQKIHIQNAKDTTGPASVQQLLKAGRLEAESIEILPGGAVPAVIRRPAGKFILLLVNHSKDAAAKFVLDPAAVGEGAPGAEPVLQLVDPGRASNHRFAGLVDLPPGEFHLKAANTGKTLCRLVIE